MGNSASSAEKEKMREENRRKMAQDEQRQNEYAAEQKRRMDEENQRELDEEREKKEREVEMAAQQNLKKVDAKIAELAGLKDKHDKEVLEWRAKAHEDQNKINAKLVAEAAAEKEKRRLEFEREENVLNQKKKELEKERDNHLKTIEDGSKRREQMQLAHNEKTDQQNKDHKEYLLKSNEEMKQFRLDQQQEMKRLKESGRAQQMAFLDRSERFQAERLAASVAIMDSIKTDTKNDDFRENCNKLRDFFRGLNQAFSPIERSLTSVYAEMRRKKALTKLPNTDIVLDAFDNLSDYVNGFTLPEKFSSELTGPLESIIKMMETIKEAIDKLGLDIGDYQDAEKKENEEEMDASDQSFKENFDLVKKTLSDLAKEMRLFDIPMSNDAVETITGKMKALNSKEQWSIEDGGSSKFKKLTD